MTVQVKICGIRTRQALDAALDAGVDYYGLVFYPPSPRSLTARKARILADRAGARATSVALLVDPSDADLEAVLDAVDPGMIQLHGREPPERVAGIGRAAGRPVIKAIRIETAADAAAAAAYGNAADLILFDAKPPAEARASLPGGNGYAFDWRLLGDAGGRRRFVLSGGLDAANVAQAIRLTGAAIVDVSSGVERAPGDKDPDLIRRFVMAAKAAELAAQPDA